MEILNALYNHNSIIFYLIGAILVIILIFIVISSMITTPKVEDKEKILEDPMENNNIESKSYLEEIIKTEKKEHSRINDMVEELYQEKIKEEINEEELNMFSEEVDGPKNIIQEKVTEKKEIEQEEKIETHEEPKKVEDIEFMLKRLYDLRQNENNIRKTALLNEIYDLKKQLDETIKKDEYNFSLDYENYDIRALADYYIFNEDIEFPKLK